VKQAAHYPITKAQGAFQRALAFALLAFIIVGTTVGAAHSHGQRVTTKTTTGQFSTNSESQSTNTTQSCADCLICQLHQQFATSLVVEPPTIAAAVVGSLSFNTIPVSIHSLRSTPRNGRAPPSFFV